MPALKALILSLLLLLPVTLFTGCMSSPEPAYEKATQQATQNPTSDLVSQAVLIQALKSEASNVPEQLSQVQGDGLAVWLRDENVLREPDGSIYSIQLPNGTVVPSTSASEQLVKWNLNNTLSGNMAGLEKLWLKVGAASLPEELELARYKGGRDGFDFGIEKATGEILTDPDMITAQLEGQAAIMEAIGESLGSTLEQHWAGARGLIEVRNDGMVEIINAAGEQIVGRLISLDPVAGGSQMLTALLERANGSTEQVLISREVEPDAGSASD